MSYNYSGNVHARVHPQWRFEESLRHNDIFQVISLWLPSRFVWKESVKFDLADCLNLRKLSRSVLEQFYGLTKSKLGRLCNTDGPKLFTKEILRMFRYTKFIHISFYELSVYIHLSGRV